MVYLLYYETDFADFFLTLFEVLPFMSKFKSVFL